MKNKEFNKTTKYLKKNRKEIYRAIIPIVVICLLVTIIGILIPKPNDNITPSNKDYLFENRNPTFNVAFGNQKDINKSYVRFEAKTSDNPFEQKEQSFWSSVTQLFTHKKGIEFGLSQVKFSETDSDIGKKINEQIGSAIEQMEIDDVSTNTEVIEVGRLLGENTDSESKKTVINKNVYPGIDLEYQILEDLGVKEEIVIRNIDEYTSNCGNDSECLLPLNEFVFDLKLDDGLQLKQSMATIRGKIENTYYITDEDDNYIAHFLPTFAVDESGSKTSAVDLDISQVDGNNYKVVVTLDPDWLFSNKRVFPIRIDPSIVHDTTTEFDTGSDYNTEVVTGPKVQLEDPEVYYTDSNVVGYWRMDDNVTSIIPNDADLEGYWDLDETSGAVYDSSGNSNTGTPSGTTSVDGKIMNGRNFNGSGDYVSIADNSGLGSTRMTVEAWIKPDTAAVNGPVYNRRTATNEGGVSVEFTGSGDIRCYFYISGSWTYASTGVITLGEWSHVGCTYDGSNIRAYLNGSNVGTTPISGNINMPSSPTVWLGRNITSTGYYFDGVIDEVGVYSSALTTTEINNRYELGKDLLDSSGNDNNAMTYGTTYTQNTVFGGGRSFDTTNDWIDLGNLGNPSAGTIDFWVKFNKDSLNTQQYLFDGRDTGNWWLLYDYTSGACTDTEGNICFNGLVEIPSTLLLADTWYNVAVTASSTQTQIFLDGKLIDTGNGLDPSFASVRIGTRYTNSTYFDGYIDEVLISDVARSDDEIARIYQIGYEKMIQGAHTSAGLNFGSTADIETISWIPVGDNTGDGETPYSTTSLVGQWNFNETSGTTADNVGSCGSSCDGTLTNFSYTGSQDAGVDSGWTSNNRRWGNGALMFDGTNDYMSVSSLSGISTGNTLHTIEGWIKPTEKPSTRQWVVLLGGESAGNHHWLYDTDGIFHIGVWSGGQCQITPTENEWNYIAATYDGNNINCYKNGELVDSKAASFNLTSNALTLSQVHVSEAYFKGFMDSFRIYSRALSSTEILSNYQSGNIEMKYRTSTDGSTWSSWKGGSESSVEGFDDDEYLYDQDETDLVGYWPMDQITVSSVEDVTSNGNDGTANGSSSLQALYRQGRYFDGSNDYIQVSNDSSLQLSTTFSYSAWIMRLSDTGGWERIMSKSDTSGVDYYMQIASDDKLHCGLNTSGAVNNSRRSATSIPVGQWTYVACTMDSSLNWHVYINGYLDDGLQEGSRVAANVSSRNLQFGRLGSNSTWYYTFVGIVDEFQLYDTELSSTQVLDHWLKRSSDYSSNYATLDKDTQSNSVDGNNSLELKADNNTNDIYTAGYWKMDDNVQSIVPTDSSLEGYWDLVESSGSGAYLLDKSDNTNNGTPSGTTYSDGKIYGGRNFNGSSDNISVSNNTTIDFERTESFSVEAWFRADGATGTTTRAIVSKSTNSGTYRGYDVSIYDDDLWFLLVNTWDTNCIAVFADGVSVTDGEWHHVIVTYDGSSSSGGVTMYIDGTSRTLTSYRNNLTSTTIETNPLTIGSRNGGAYWDGEIDEAGVYSKELNSTEALLRYWEGLDIKDSSGHYYHGKTGYLPYVEGKVGGARDFNGTSDHITVNSNLNLANNNFTLEAWAKRDTTGSYQFLMTQGTAATNSGLHLGFRDTDVLTCAFYGNDLDSPLTYTDNGWHHFACTYNAVTNIRKLYVDGLVVAQDKSSADYQGTGDFVIGMRGFTGNYYFDGLIDEVRVSNIARTQEEILSDYNFAKGEYFSKSISSNDISDNTMLPFWVASDNLGSNIEMIYSEEDYGNLVPDDHTVGYWNFDTYRNPDISGNGNDGRDTYHGIEYGIRDWNVSVLVNQFNGGANNGEFDLTCPSGDASCYLVTMDGDVLHTPSINYGVAMQDGGSGNAYLMYSPSLTGQGISPYGDGSNNYIGVRWTGSVWQYDNNSSWITFTPNENNILVAYLTLFTSVSGLTLHPTPVDGVYGEGRDFDGTKDYIYAAGTDGTGGNNLPTGDFTYDMWLNVDTFYANQAPVMIANSSGGNELLVYVNTSGQVMVYTDGTVRVTSSNSVRLNEWEHLTITRSSGTIRIYINGIQDPNTGSDSAVTLNFEGCGMLIGIDSDSGCGVTLNDAFDGKLDDVRVSNIARTPDEIRQAYEMGRRTHPIKVSFKAGLESSNLISGVSDTSFTINEQNYGAGDYIENIDIGEKIIIKETYQGVEYIAQGDIATRNTSTGAVTVSSWDGTSTFPLQGFTTAATVFKWQREYVDIRYPLDEDINGITKLTFRKTTDTPAVFYIDDLKKATYSSDYDASEFGALGASTAVETQIDSFDQDYLYETTASNLTAYYPMDETSGTGVDNVISGSYDGTASGTNIIDGKFGMARRFDGSNDYVNIGSSLHPSLPVSIAAWIYLENNNVGMGVFNNDKFVGTTHNHSGIFINVTSGGILSVNFGDNTACSTTSRQTAETQKPLQTGKWIHMVGILRGASDIDIYLDGIKQPVNYTGTGGSLSYASRNGAIGAVTDCSTGGTNSFDGSIDELQVYTRSLTASEVWNLYKTGSTSPRSIRSTNIANHIEGTGAWQFDSDTYTVDPATVGLWHLDESSGSGAYLVDSSYNSYNGTPTGTTYVSAGKFNGARSFDGTGSDYITTSLDTEADSLYADTGNTWTVEAWFKHNGGLTEDGVIVGRGAGTGTSGHFGIFVDTSGNLRTVIRGAYTTITSSVADNAWHHVAVTWNGTIGRGYFDGEYQTELSIGTATTQAYNVSIGAQRNGENFYYEGQIDEVRIANVALGADEISSAYNMGEDNYVTKTFDTSDLSDNVTLPFWIASDNLGNNFDVIYGQDSYGLYEPDVYTEGLWHLDESSGTLYDSSTNGNNATASGTTYVTGRHDGARSFNGTSDYIDAGTSSTLAPTTELTVSAWVYADSGPASEGRTAVSKLNWVSSTESYGWNLGAMWTGWSFDFIVSDGGSTNDHIVEDPTFFSKYMGEWVHVTGVFKSGEYIRLYENGELVAEETSSVPTALSYSSNSLTIGRRSSQSQSEWDGMIDEVRVSSKALSNSEVQAEYNRGSYTHNITVDFKADLQSGNLISNSGDTSFTISEQAYGATNPIENLSTGDKIVVKETVSGTEYIAQGDVDTLSTSTGAVTVDAWDSGSTFPGSGFTTAATVFKWQMEEIDISDFLTDGETDLDDIVFKKVSDVEGILWVDDLNKSTAAYNPDTTYLEGVQYVQYQAIFTKWDDNPYLDLYLSEVSVDYSSGPTMDQLMRHGKWFNGSGEEQPFWWVGN